MRTKTFLVAGLAAVMTIALGAPYAGAGKGRTVSYDYRGPNRITAANGTFTSQGCLTVTEGCEIGTPEVEVRRGERFVTVKVADELNSSVGATINYSQGGMRREESFCGKTASPIRVKPGSVLYFHLDAGVCSAESTPTTGTVTLTFTR